MAGIHALLHYMQHGAAALRNPHPNFDAGWYVSQHPDAIGNPLLYHIRTGVALGYTTERPIDIDDYLPSARPAMRRPPGVVADVVIPAYRGLEETRNCIESVLADWDDAAGRIIVVDDCSPEPALSAWLLELAAQKRIQLIRNRRNLGFVASVNLGMAAAGANDVVLLNSDTRVPPGWLARLMAQAYAHPRIASVSPFSNNATICGYPDDHGGDLVFGRSVTEMDAVCRTANAGRWVDVPTTVGFCMYIRRAALDEVGVFDAKRFTVGYGEENDFCLRASASGWQHRLACDTFVYHKGSVSFGDRAKALSERAMTLILERFPGYLGDVARHVSAGAVIPFRFALTAALLRQSALPVILMVTHDLGGGIQHHIETLTARYDGSAHILLLTATDRGAALSVPALPNHPTLALPAERRDDLVCMLRSMNVARVHIHSLVGMDMDVRALIRDLEVPFDTTVHDYYAICPQINLLPRGRDLYCGEPDIGGCNACIANRSSHGARDIVSWRAEYQWQLADAARVLCPSADVLTRLERYGVVSNAVLAPHEAVAPAAWSIGVPPLRGTTKLRIAVLGTLSDHKGGRTVASVAEHLDPRTTELHLIGHTEAPFSESAAQRMTITGRYDDADLPGLIKAIAPHVIWFPAAWPETFSFTLSAAIDAGVPIVATRIGAHTERLAGRPFTWLIDADTAPSAWIRIFNDIRTALRSTAPPAPPPMRAAVADFYATAYLNPPKKRRPRQSRPRLVIVPERFDIGFPTPCGYIRLLQPLHHSAVANDFDVRVANTETMFDQKAEIVVTQRFALPDIATADRLVAHTRRIGATLVFDLDDDLLTIPRHHPDAKLLRPRSKIARRLVGAADVLWVSTPALAERLSTIRADAVVLENGLDERIWRESAGPALDQPVRILCMGTTTHDHDFNLILPALCRLKDEYRDRIEIDIAGMSGGDLPAGLNRIGPPHHATRSYPGFVNWLSSAQPGWHIGLAPLLETPFNLCKSPIKAMDYAAIGLAVLASDMPVYRGSIADGPAGRLVANAPAAWYAALNRLLRYPDERRAMAACARQSFLDSASLAAGAAIRKDALRHILSVRKRHAAA